MPRLPSHRLARFLGILGLVAAGLAHAGLDLETLCLDCHRGRGTTVVTPRIEGQHSAYLAVQLGRFADRHREGFPMSALSDGLDAAAIARISEDLAARAWQTEALADPGERGAIGREQLEALDCASCHGSDYRGGDSIPRLAGQRAAYLARQIGGFSLGDRHHPPLGGGMRMYRLAAEDIEALAAALAALD